MSTATPLATAAPPTVDMNFPTDDALPLQLLRDELAIDAAIGDVRGATRMLMWLVAVVSAGFAAHGAALAGMYWPMIGPADAGLYGGAWAVAATAGFFAAISAGLPSYWFYGVVARIRAPAWRLAVELVRVQAVGAVVLVGVLPFWLAAALGVRVLFGYDLMEYGPWVALTHMLPFLAALPGVFGLTRAFRRMRDALGEERSWAPAALTGWWVLMFNTTGPITIWAIFNALIT